MPNNPMRPEPSSQAAAGIGVGVADADASSDWADVVPSLFRLTAATVPASLGLAGFVLRSGVAPNASPKMARDKVLIALGVLLLGVDANVTRKLRELPKVMAWL